jgi:hypothetical protein
VSGLGCEKNLGHEDTRIADFRTAPDNVGTIMDRFTGVLT